MNPGRMLWHVCQRCYVGKRIAAANAHLRGHKCHAQAPAAQLYPSHGCPLCCYIMCIRLQGTSFMT